VLSPETVKQYAAALTAIASALVRSGVPADGLTTIAALVRPKHVETALRYLHARAGGRVSTFIGSIADRAPTIAAHVGLPEEDQARLRELRSMVTRDIPSRRGLTAKNRRLLDQLDDRAFADRLVALPARIMAAARPMTHRPRAASLARDAVATELLLCCGMRIGNLVGLRLGETIPASASGPRRGGRSSSHPRRSRTASP
jgi:integrase